MRYLALLLALVATPVPAAELRLETDAVQATLLDTPCSSKIVLALIKPDAQKLYQNGTVTFGGITTPLCWRVSPDSKQVWVIDEDSETAMIPIEMFRPKASI